MQFGDFEEAVVICNGSDNCNGLVLVGFLGGLGLGLRDDAGDRDGRAIDARLKKALENDFVEVGVSATYSIGKVSVFVRPFLLTSICSWRGCEISEKG